MGLRNSFKNFRRGGHESESSSKSSKSEPPKKRLRMESSNGLPEEEYALKVTELNQECDKRKKNHALIKDLMEITFAGRRKWIDERHPYIIEVIEAFPPLSTTKAVSL